MDVTYVIVKVYITECNDVIKRHCNASNVDVSHQSDCIIKKIYVQKWKVCKRKKK